MERSLACLLAALACLMTRASARDCLQCWREVCTTGSFVSNTIFNNDCCNCVDEPDDCVTSLTNADSSPDCCLIARERIFSRLSPQSEPNDVCNSSSPYPFIDPTDILPIPVTDLATFPPGAYLVPGFKFQCRGCVDEVKLQGQIPGFSKPDNTTVNITVNFTIWSRLVDTQDDEDLLFSLKQSVTIVATEEDVEPESARRKQLTITFSLPGNDELCFNEDEEFGLSFEGTSGLQVILTRTENNNMGSTYTLSPSEDNTCPELNDFHTATLVQEDRVPLMAIHIRPPQPLSSVTQLPSSSPSPLVTPPAATTTTTNSPSSSEVVAAPSSTTPQPTPSVPPIIVVRTDSQQAVSPGVVIGVASGSVAVLALIVLIFMAFLLISRRRRYDTDKVDGSGQRLSRVRSLRMEQRLQENSQIQLLPMGGAGRALYDYPTTQVHPYHELEPPLDPQHHTLLSSANYTTMQPAGSVREGAITPVGNGAHTIQSIYDDDMASGEHGPGAPQLPPPRRVQDLPLYHVLEAPGQINGQPVTQVGYDDPVELLHRQGSKEEIVNPIYNEIGVRLQQNPQMVDPSVAHPYHVLENPTQQRGEGAEGEMVEEQGLYVPTAEERRRILANPSRAEDDLENWIKKNRAESTKKRRFFESTSTYWKPPSDADSLYNTLAQRKYREILSDQIQIVKYIGSGQFGTVNLAVWKQQYVEPMEVAVKVCRAGKNEAIKTKFLKEAAIMGQFRHPNVVKLYGVVTMSELPMIMLELMKNGDLLDYMKKNFEPGTLPPPSPTRLLSFSMQVARGMEYLSGKSFVHRDLAARNILLNELHQCKIGDFGMARDLEDSEYYIMSRKGPLPFKWTAPEALNYRKYSTFSDCYSYGMVLYEIWAVGREPLPGVKIKDVPDLVSKGFCQAPPPGCPRAIYELMVKLWNPNKRHRPTFPQVVECLGQPEERLLDWAAKDRAVSSQAALLGAPLEEAKNLYPTLQNAYQSSWC